MACESLQKQKSVMRSAVRQAFRWQRLIPWLILLAGLAFIYIFLASILLLLGTPHEDGYWERFFICAFLRIGAIMILVLPIAVFMLARLRSKRVRWFFASVLTLYYALHLCTSYFFWAQGMPFDFFYFWLNRAVAYETVAHAYSFLPFRLSVVAITAAVFCWALVAAKKQVPPQKFVIFRGFTAVIAVVWVMTFFTTLTPLLRLAYDIRITYNIMQLPLYEDLYQSSLAEQAPVIPDTLKTNNSLVFLHLETVNSDFVSPSSTPVLFERTAAGTLLTRHHSAAVQTHRAEEVILCGSLPSLFRSESVGTYETIIDQAAAQGTDLTCLPEILKAAGYKTLFFKSHDLSFRRTTEFMSTAGFDEVHDQHDIMKPGDPLLDWGAREDVFYRRVVEYLAEHYINQKVFAYIAVSSTNHHPWHRGSINTREDVLGAMPVFTGDKRLLRRKQSLFAQDLYMQDFFDAYEKEFSFDSTDVFIFGDHPMPIARGKIEQYVGSAGIDEENFLTSLGFIPAGNHAHDFVHGQVLTGYSGTSHSDIAPTVLELVGIANPYRFGDSFYAILTGEDSRDAGCTFNVMPYYGAATSLVQYPHKVIVNLFSGRIEYANLAQSDERRRTLSRTLDRADVLFEACRTNTLADADMVRP